MPENIRHCGQQSLNLNCGRGFFILPILGGGWLKLGMAELKAGWDGLRGAGGLVTTAGCLGIDCGKVGKAWKGLGGRNCAGDEV